MSDVSDRQAIEFKRFLVVLSNSKDTELVLLKAHILIEEQIRQIIKERLVNPEAIKEAKLECFQAICLAQSFFPSDFLPWLWDALKKLNKLRNDIAHQATVPGLQDRIEHFVCEYPWGFSELEDNVARLELSLWSIFAAVSDLVERPAGEMLEKASNGEE